MAQQVQINSSNGFREIFDCRRENLKQVMGREVQEAIDNEFNLMELNLFVSSVGKDKIKEATQKVRKLREKVDNGKLDLSEYEDMAEDF